jgi:hypothetical protein
LGSAGSLGRYGNNQPGDRLAGAEGTISVRYRKRIDTSSLGLSAAPRAGLLCVLFLAFRIRHRIHGRISDQTVVLFRPASFWATLDIDRRRPPTERDTKALQKRVLRRTRMVLGLGISQPEVHAGQLLVHTLDISSTGAKIGAVREYIHSGSVLLIQRGHNRTQCRVIWSRPVGLREIQIGIEFLKHSPRFWELDLDDGSAGVWLSSSQR